MHHQVIADGAKGFGMPHHAPIHVTPVVVFCGILWDVPTTRSHPAFSPLVLGSRALGSLLGSRALGSLKVAAIQGDFEAP